MNNSANIHPYKVHLLDKATCYNFLLANGQTAGWSWSKRRLQDQVAKYIKGVEHNITYRSFDFSS